MGIDQTEQTKIAIGQTEAAARIFSRPVGLSHWTPRRGSRQYLSWFTDFILGGIINTLT